MSEEAYKDVLGKLGLPQDLSSKLESLLCKDPNKNKGYEDIHQTFQKKFTEIKKAKKEFGKAFSQIKKQTKHFQKNYPKKGNMLTDGKEDDDKKGHEKKKEGGKKRDHKKKHDNEDDSSSSSDFPLQSSDSDFSFEDLDENFINPEDKQKILNDSKEIKFLEKEFLERKSELSKALDDLKLGDIDESKIYQKIAEHMKMGFGDYDVDKDNAELDKVMYELKSLSQQFQTNQFSGGPSGSRPGLKQIQNQPNK